MKKYYIVADGACRKNPGPGGWGLIVVYPDGQVKEFGGHDPETTNNRMEMMGFYNGLQQVYRHGKTISEKRIVRVICDSKYVLDGAEKYIYGWNRNGWKTSTGDDVKNQDLWQKIAKGLGMMEKIGFVFEYELVKGHAGHEANERVDVIAVKFSHEDHVDLYGGPIEQYPVKVESGEIRDRTKKASVPAEKFDAIYLSLVNGVLKRHKTWPECQAEVTGRAGAKYKKIKNAAEEQEVLKQWGIA